MTKRTDTNRPEQFTARIHKQHSSLVITVPKGLCKMLDWGRGDILLFEAETGGLVAVVGKSVFRVTENGRNKADSG